MKKLQLISAILLLTMLSISCGGSDDAPAPTCDEAIQATLTAQLAFSNATENQYTSLCNAYKAALENQIDACGDTTGDLQAIIDGLNCTPAATTGTLSMNLGSAPLAFDLITVTTTGTTRHVHGEQSNTTSYDIDFDVEVGQTGANKIENFELRLFSQTFRPLIPAAFGNDWTSNITVNSGTSVVGTFHGELVNEGETSVQDLLSGVVNVSF